MRTYRSVETDELYVLRRVRPRKRQLILALCAVSISGCASVPTDTCQLKQPPDSALIRVTQGVSLATFPPRISAEYSGCQRTWLGDERDLHGMQSLATAHFASGRLLRFESAAPGSAETA